MKCAEVMEWMHRYLDHDLSQDEIIEMFRHIDDCPSCADVFDRLTLLSQQLEQLPDVKPPFSLVDSIMPQLEELDRGVQEHSTMSPEEPKVVPFSRKSTRSKSSKGASMATRTGIGAVAAAIILLIAIFNMPDNMPAADVDQALNQAAETSAGSEAYSKMNTGSSDAAPEASQSASADSGAGTMSTQEFALPLDNNDTSAGSAAKVQPSAAPTDKAADTAPATTQEPASAKQASPIKQNKVVSPAPEDSVKSSRNSSDVNAAQGISSGGNNDSAADTSAAMKESDQLPDSEKAGVMSLLPSLVAAQSSWSSPDGRFEAELAGQQIVIYALPAGGLQEERTALTSLPFAGAWVSGVWSADSRQFTYVTEQNGTDITEVYTLPESASADAPAVSPGASATAAPTVTPDAAPSTK